MNKYKYNIIDNINNIKNYLITNIYNITIRLFILFSIILIIYYIYKLYINNKYIYKGYSYYDKNILNYVPLFKLDTHDFDECINKCYKLKNCKGITLNPIEEKCYGTGKNGVLRKENINEIKSWIKSDESIFNLKSNILLTFTSKNIFIDKSLITEPYSRGQINYSFYIYINELKYGEWKHIFHKGSYIENINTNDWDNITAQVPKQFIGAWFAPYNNTLRISITNNIGNIEYIDINYILQNKLYFISINIIDNNIEIYLNTKIIKIYQLKYKPIYNYGNIYSMYENTFNGYLCYLTYTPQHLSYKKIQDLYKSSYNEINYLIENNNS